MKIEIRHSIEDEKLRLTEVESRRTCARCGRLLALVNRDSILIRSRAALISETGLVLRCGDCRAFSEFAFGDETPLLAI